MKKTKSKAEASKAEEFDIVILGSGQAGSFIAWTMAGKGKRVVVIERKWVGGACPNVACMPSKNIIHSAKIASYFYRSEQFGIYKENTRIDMVGVREHKRKMVAEMRDLSLGAFKSSGAELVLGVGRLTGDRTVAVDLNDGSKRVFHGKDVVINTGSRAFIEPIPGLVEAGPLTHIEALELDHIPGHLLILGGGYIGLELAQAMRRFGAEVTIIDRGDRLVRREDQDISEALQQLCQDEGIKVVTGFTATRVEGKSGERVRIVGRQQGKGLSLEGTEILVASGRTPNTDNLGLESAGVALTERRHVKVNERLQTTAPGVWAVGDCAGSPYFTHISHDDFRVVCDNLTGIDHKTTGRQVPFCLFTDPEFARVGLSETEAKEQNIPYRLAKIPMAAVIRARTLAETRGFMKALIDTASDRLLGFTAFGVGVGEIMPTVQVAMAAGLPYTLLRDSVIAHPTIAEGLGPLFSSVPPRS
jgi:pyruvate/2-oxoglutarate dehydrogenase complex dihydrolipoamide dehydrogenase (E3) component